MSFEEQSHFQLFEVQVSCTTAEFNEMQAELWKHPSFHAMRVQGKILSGIVLRVVTGADFTTFSDMCARYINLVEECERVALRIVENHRRKR